MSDTGPPRKEPPPSELRIGAPPRPVTRLSRRTLVVATALVAALVFAALWYALGIRPIRFAGGPELYNTNAKPTDALANMRDSYADLTRPKPAPSLPQPVPQLGPPLPGDLGRPMVQQQTGAPTPPVDPEAERRRREREQAAASVVFFTVSARPAALAGAAQGQAAEGGASTPSLEGSVPQTSAGDDLSIQNGQSHKEGFLNGQLSQAIYSPQRVQTPRSPYQLMAGSVIAAALITGLNSDLPGQVVAQVSEDVYDTVTGRFLLVPQGTRLIGKYDSHIAYGQERAAADLDTPRHAGRQLDHPRSTSLLPTPRVMPGSRTGWITTPGGCSKASPSLRCSASRASWPPTTVPKATAASSSVCEIA